MDIASRIHQLCDKKNIRSIYELAKITKIPQSTLQSIIAGHSPKTDTLEKICNGLGITLADFFFDEQKKATAANGDDLKTALLNYPILVDVLKKYFLPAIRQETVELIGPDAQVITIIDNIDNLPYEAQAEFIAQFLNEKPFSPEVDPIIDEVLDKIKNMPTKNRKILLQLLIDSISNGS